MQTVVVCATYTGAFVLDLLLPLGLSLFVLGEGVAARGDEARPPRPDCIWRSEGAEMSRGHHSLWLPQLKQTRLYYLYSLPDVLWV